MQARRQNFPFNSAFEVWRIVRWTARSLLPVMLAPAFGPLAMACAARPGAIHCMRYSGSAHSAQSPMPCHHAMAGPNAAQSESSKVGSPETSVHASNDGNCCQNHCCCGPITSEWAQPACSLLFFLSLLIEPARPSRDSAPQSIDIFGHDSPRAPPRS